MLIDCIIETKKSIFHKMCNKDWEKNRLSIYPTTTYPSHVIWSGRWKYLPKAKSWPAWQAHGCSCTRDGCGFDPLGLMKYFIFSFPGSSNEAKRGVKFRYSTRNASRIRRKEERRSRSRRDAVAQRKHDVCEFHDPSVGTPMNNYN